MKYVICFLFGLFLVGCNNNSKIPKTTAISQSSEACAGIYEGPEFRNGSDVAHQFSNEMCELVGDKLKELYGYGQYSKVDFANIKMTTEGMGTGEVVYKLRVPFVRVENKCDAMTSFDHSGGWDHSPALEARKRQLQSALMPGEELDISELKTTSEGLQEYWIQWKNKEVQADCQNTN